MTAPDHTLAPFKNHLHQRGHPYMHKGWVRDSSRESSVVAGRHEQTHTPDLQDQELAGLQ